MPAALKAVKTAKPLTTGKLIDSIWELKEEKKKLSAQEKKLNEQIEELETQLFEKLDAEDTTRGSGAKASASIGESTQFSFDGEDGFDQFAKFVKKTGYFHLFQRRVTAEACREVLQQKGAVPGLKIFTKRTINLTTLK